MLYQNEIITLEKIIKSIFCAKNLMPKLVVLHLCKKFQVLQKIFLKKNPSSLIVHIRFSKLCGEIF